MTTTFIKLKLQETIVHHQQIGKIIFDTNVGKFFCKYDIYLYNYWKLNELTTS